MDADTNTPSISEILRSYAFRLCVYSVLTYVVFEAIYAGVQTHGAARMGAENGPIEMAQLGLAIIGAVGLFCAAWWSPIGRAGLVMCGAVVTYAAARESDLLLETALFDDAYKWVVGLPMVILVVVVVIADRHRLVEGIMWLMHHPAATLFAVAGVFLCFVCQVLDRPDMWVGISNGHEAETTKALIEEYTELFAYLLLACSGIEAAILAYSGRAKQRKASLSAELESFPRVAA
jgi:hypothetical protein